MHRIKVNAITCVGDYLLSYDICPARFLRDLGLPPAALLGNDLWLDRDSCFLVAENLSRVSGDPVPGMHITEHVDLRVHGLWSDLILAAATVGDAIRASIANVGLIESGRQIALRSEGARVHWETGFLGHMAFSPREYLAASAVLLNRFIGLATEHIPVEVHLVQNRPADTSEYERIFGPNLVFDADRTAIAFDRDALALPMDERKVARVYAETNHLTASHAHTAAAVVRTVQAIIPFERPTAANVAEALRMNIRTMQRHLETWGVSFQELLQDIRLHHALIGLGQNGRTVTEVAFELGYSDTAHFTRAFQRWTGESPSHLCASRRRVHGTPVSLLTGAP